MADFPNAIRLDRLERTSDDHGRRLTAVEGRVDSTESRLDIIGARLGVYAALGAIVGGAVATAFAAILLH